MKGTAITAAMLIATSSAACEGQIKSGRRTYKSGECVSDGIDGSLKLTCISDTQYTYHHYAEHDNKNCKGDPVHPPPHDKRDLKNDDVSECKCDTSTSTKPSGSASASANPKSALPSTSATQSASQSASASASQSASQTCKGTIKISSTKVLNSGQCRTVDDQNAEIATCISKTQFTYQHWMYTGKCEGSLITPSSSQIREVNDYPGTKCECDASASQSSSQSASASQSDSSSAEALSGRRRQAKVDRSKSSMTLDQFVNSMVTLFSNGISFLISLLP